MSSAFSNAEQVVNDALRRIGLRIRVGSMWEGSEPAKAALDVYAQTRDALLREIDPDFAEATATLAASAATVPAQWSYAYVYPADCIHVKAVFPPSYLSDQNNPLPENWTVAAGVVSGAAVRVVVANFSGASAVYTKRVTDPSVWDASFTEAMCAGLARRLSPSLSENPNLEKFEADDEQSSAKMAAATLG